MAGWRWVAVDFAVALEWRSPPSPLLNLRVGGLLEDSALSNPVTCDIVMGSYFPIK